MRMSVLSCSSSNILGIQEAKLRNYQTVSRSISEMHHLRQLDSRMRLVVLSEEGASFDHLKVYGVETVYVPKGYAPSKAKYKARALEYFRMAKELNDDDWVLHLDEETAIDKHCLLTCFDFIERDVKFDYGQVGSSPHQFCILR